MQYIQQSPQLRIPQAPMYGSATAPASNAHQATGSSKTNNSFEHMSAMPPHAAQMPTTVGPGRHASPRHTSPLPGTFVDTPQTARAWQATVFVPVTPQTMPPQRIISAGPGLGGASLNAPTNPCAPVATPEINGMDLTMATVPMPPVEVTGQLSHGPPSQSQLVHGPQSQVRLEQLPIQVATEEVVSSSVQPTARTGTTWVQRSANPDLAACRQQSGSSTQTATLTRVASGSPSRSNSTNAFRRMNPSPTPPTEKVTATSDKVSVSLLAKEEQVAEVQKRIAEEAESNKQRFDMVQQEIQELKVLHTKASQGVDTSDQVLNALRTAKSAGDLRCAIKRAEETQLPEGDLQFWRGQLPSLVRAEEEKAALEEQRRIEEKRRAEAQFAAEKQDQERKLHEVNADLSQARAELAHFKAALKKEEDAKRRVSEEIRAIEKRHSQEIFALEKDRDEMKVRYDSLRQHADQRSTDYNELKKQLGSIKEENRDMRSQNMVLRNRDQQQAETLRNTESQNESLRAENGKLREQASQISAKHQQAVSAYEQENINIKQRLQKAEVGTQDLGKKNYNMEIQLRKAHWSSTNPSPAEFINMAKKREYDDNLSRQVAHLTKQNGEFKTLSEEYRARNEVLWKYVKELPSDKEAHLQNDLEALRHSQRGRSNRM